jgi:integrase
VTGLELAQRLRDETVSRRGARRTHARLLRVADRAVKIARLFEHEIEAALRVQQRLRCRASRRRSRASMSRHLQAPRGVSGDYFDFIELPEGRLGLVVADVCGKGMPAACWQRPRMRRSRLRAVRRTQLRRVLASVNQLLYETTPEERFVTMALRPSTTRRPHTDWGQSGHCPTVCRLVVFKLAARLV